MSTLTNKNYDNIESLSKSEIKTILNRMGISLDRSKHPKSYYISLYNSAQKAKHKVTRDDTSFAFNGNRATTRKRKRSLKQKKQLKSEALESIEEDNNEQQSTSKKPNESKFKFTLEKEQQNDKMMSYQVKFDNEGQKKEKNRNENIIENEFVKYNMENDKDDNIIIEKEPIKVSIQMKKNSFVVNKKVPKEIVDTHSIRYKVDVKNDSIDNVFMNYKVDLENDRTMKEIEDKEIPIVHNVIKITKEPKIQQKTFISSNVFKIEDQPMIKESTFVSRPNKGEIINKIFEIPKIETHSIKNNDVSKPNEEEMPRYKMLTTTLKEEPIKENVFIQKEQPEMPIEIEEPEERYIEENNPEIVDEQPEDVRNANLIEYNDDVIPIREEEENDIYKRKENEHELENKYMNDNRKIEEYNEPEEGGIEYDDEEFKRPEQPNFIYNNYVPQNIQIKEENPINGEEEDKDGLIEYSEENKEGLIEYSDNKEEEKENNEEGLIEYSDEHKESQPIEEEPIIENNKEDEVMQEEKPIVSNPQVQIGTIVQSTQPKYHLVNESFNQTSLNKPTSPSIPMSSTVHNNTQQRPYITHNPFISSIPQQRPHYNTASNPHHSSLPSQSISYPAPPSSSIPLTTSIQNAIISVSNENNVPSYTMYTYPPNKQPLSNNFVIFTSFLSAFIIIAFIFSFNHPDTISSLYNSDLPLNALYILLLITAIVVIYKIVSVKRKYKQIAIDDYMRLKKDLHNRRINANVDTDSVIMEEFVVDASTLHQISISDYNINVLPLLREMISKDRFIIETTTVVMNDERVIWREI